MSSPPPPEGLIVDLVTPLTAAGDLDEESLKRLVSRVAPLAGGLLAGGPLAGEGLVLPLPLRRQLLHRVLSILPGRPPLLFGITGANADDTRQMALAVREEIHRLRYPGQVFLADLPLWYHSNRGLPRFYQGWPEEVDLPLVLLNLPEVVQRRGPVLKHKNIRTHVFKKLAVLPGIVGLIFRGDMRRFLHYHQAAAGRPGLAFYEGSEANFLSRPGTWGVVSSGAQLFPESWREVARFCLHPEELPDDPEVRRQVWNKTAFLLDLAHLCQDAPAPLLKEALAAKGTLKTSATAQGTPPASPRPLQKLLKTSPWSSGQPS